MNNPHLRSSERGITQFQVFLTAAALAFVAMVLALIVPPCCSNFAKGHGMVRDQLNSGLQIYLAMRNYAADTDHEGPFPTYADPKDRPGLFANANEAFEVLMPNYLDDKRPFFHKKSAWCRATPRDKSTEYNLLPGDNDWCYVRGLRNDSHKSWPLLANAFAPGATQYVKDPAKPGGALKGKNALVIWVSGSAKIVETKAAGETFFVEREDKPGANAFEKSEDWLTGENVELLYPIPPE